jgi:hypothetical protein
VATVNADETVMVALQRMKFRRPQLPVLGVHRRHRR